MKVPHLKYWEHSQGEGKCSQSSTAGVRVRVWSCAQDKRCLAKVWVVYLRCTKAKTKGAWSGIVSEGVETTRVCSSEMGQRVRTQDVVTGLGGIVVNNGLRIQDRGSTTYILQREQRGGGTWELGGST